MNTIGRVLTASSLSLLTLFACGTDSTNGGAVQANTGQSCTADNQCYSALDGAALSGGAPLCMTRVPGGYCTHHCTVDTDCCAVSGECKNQFPEVCSPFESTGEMFCFLSCENATVTQAALTDANTFCQKYANQALTCRSTGGGAKNRKVCMP
jgi:hypothetical protein